MRMGKATDEIASSCLCRGVRSLSRLITGLYDEALREAGITANQLTLLVAVERAGEIAPGELGERLAMEKSTVSRSVGRMIERGWLAAAPAEGRRRAIRTTAEGRKMIGRAHGSWRRVQQETRLALGDALSEALLAVTRK